MNEQGGDAMEVKDLTVGDHYQGRPVLAVYREDATTMVLTPTGVHRVWTERCETEPKPLQWVPTPLEPMPFSLRSYLEKVDEELQRAMSWQADAEVAEKVMVRVGIELFGAEALPQSASASVSTAGTALQGILFSVSIFDVSEMAPWLRGFAAFGYRRRKERPTDDPMIGRRMWQMKRPNGELSAIRLMFFMDVDYGGTDAGAGCRWVKVGEKAEPVFELRCGDKTAPPVAADEELVP